MLGRHRDDQSECQRWCRSPPTRGGRLRALSDPALHRPHSRRHAGFGGLGGECAGQCPRRGLWHRSAPQEDWSAVARFALDRCRPRRTNDLSGATPGPLRLVPYRFGRIDAGRRRFYRPRVQFHILPPLGQPTSGSARASSNTAPRRLPVSCGHHNATLGVHTRSLQGTKTGCNPQNGAQSEENQSWRSLQAIWV